MNNLYFRKVTVETYMTFKDMKPGGYLYRVTKGSTDGTYDTDCIIKLGKDGSINLLYPFYGWLDPEDQTVDSMDFEVELWYDSAVIDKIKDSITEKLDIDYIETIYTQAAILHSIDNEVSYHSQELWQIAEWLRELKVLRNLVSNTMKRF